MKWHFYDHWQTWEEGKLYKIWCNLLMRFWILFSNVEFPQIVHTCAHWLQQFSFCLKLWVAGVGGVNFYEKIFPRIFQTWKQNCVVFCLNLYSYQIFIFTLNNVFSLLQLHPLSIQSSQPRYHPQDLNFHFSPSTLEKDISSQISCWLDALETWKKISIWAEFISNQF